MQPLSPLSDYEPEEYPTTIENFLDSFAPHEDDFKVMLTSVLPDLTKPVPSFLEDQALLQSLEEPVLTMEPINPQHHHQYLPLPPPLPLEEPQAPSPRCAAFTRGEFKSFCDQVLTLIEHQQQQEPSPWLDVLKTQALRFGAQADLVLSCLGFTQTSPLRLKRKSPVALSPSASSNSDLMVSPFKRFKLNSSSSSETASSPRESPLLVPLNSPQSPFREQQIQVQEKPGVFPRPQEPDRPATSALMRATRTLTLQPTTAWPQALTACLSPHHLNRLNKYYEATSHPDLAAAVGEVYEKFNLEGWEDHALVYPFIHHQEYNHYSRLKRANLNRGNSTSLNFWDPERFYYLEETQAVYCPTLMPRQQLPVSPLELTDRQLVALLASGLFTTQLFRLAGGPNAKLWKHRNRPITAFVYQPAAFFPRLDLLAAAQVLVLGAHHLLSREPQGLSISYGFTLWRSFSTWTRHTLTQVEKPNEASLEEHGLLEADDTHVTLGNSGKAYRHVLFTRLSMAYFSCVSKTIGCRPSNHLEVAKFLEHVYSPLPNTAGKLDTSALEYHF